MLSSVISTLPFVLLNLLKAHQSSSQEEPPIRTHACGFPVPAQPALFQQNGHIGRLIHSFCEPGFYLEPLPFVILVCSSLLLVLSLWVWVTSFLLENGYLIAHHLICHNEKLLSAQPSKYRPFNTPLFYIAITFSTSFLGQFLYLLLFSESASRPLGYVTKYCVCIAAVLRVVLITFHVGFDGGQPLI